MNDALIVLAFGAFIAGGGLGYVLCHLRSEATIEHLRSTCRRLDYERKHLIRVAHAKPKPVPSRVEVIGYPGLTFIDGYMYAPPDVTQTAAGPSGEGYAGVKGRGFRQDFQSEIPGSTSRA